MSLSKAVAKKPVMSDAVTEWETTDQTYREVAKKYAAEGVTKSALQRACARRQAGGEAEPQIGQLSRLTVADIAVLHDKLKNVACYPHT